MLPFFPFLRRMRHGLTIGVRVIATDAADHLLLVRHTYVPGWHLPGGGVDVGETTEAAARRELMEEANVEVAGPLHLHGVYFNPKVGGRDHVVCYRADLVNAGPRPGANLEIIAAEFFPLDELPPELSPATLRRLAEWRGGLARSDMW